LENEKTPKRNKIYVVTLGQYYQNQKGEGKRKTFTRKFIKERKWHYPKPHEANVTNLNLSFLFPFKSIT
jgi:hypothetical protein